MVSPVTQSSNRHGQLQISSAVGGLGGWELGGEVEGGAGGDDGKWRERERETGGWKEGWEKFSEGGEELIER